MNIDTQDTKKDLKIDHKNNKITIIPVSKVGDIYSRREFYIIFSAAKNIEPYTNISRTIKDLYNTNMDSIEKYVKKETDTLVVDKEFLSFIKDIYNDQLGNFKFDLLTKTYIKKDVASKIRNTISIIDEYLEKE